MRLLRVGQPGREAPVVMDDQGRAFDLAPLLDGGDIDGAFLERGDIDRAREAMPQGDLEEISLEGSRVGPPTARPGAVICIGQNYAAHAAESGASPPEEPIIFFKRLSR